MSSINVQSAEQLSDAFDDLLSANEESAHIWLRARFQELGDTALSRENDEASVRAAEIVCDLAGISEAEHAFTIESNGILSPSGKTVQARAAAVCKRLAELLELTTVERI